MEDFNGSKNFPLNVEMSFLRKLIGWATFNAVFDIISGAFACLGIITAAYGIPKIIAGVRLLNVTEEIRKYMDTNNYEKVSEIFSKFHGYFKINGISTIIKICLLIIIIILYIVIIVLFISKMPDFMRNYRY